MLKNSLKCPTVKNKIVELIWIITHNSQRITLLSVSMIKAKCKIKQKMEQIER